MKLVFHLQNGKVETFSIQKDSVTIGRGEMCDVVLPYAGFSRKHAQIELIGDEIFVTDLGSTNGVYLDGEKIPPFERKPSPSYLTLQIGPTNQIEIMADDVTPQMQVINKKEITRPHTNLNIKQSADATRTTRIDPALLKEGLKKKKPVKKQDSNITIIILLLCVLGVAGYFYTQQNEEVAPVNPEVQIPPPVVVPLTETEFLSAAVLDSTYKNASCETTFAHWCNEARVLVDNKEGVVIEGKTLIVYLNMDSFINETYAEAFNQLDVLKRLEILALRRVFNANILRSFLRQNALDTLQVVAGTIKEDQYSPFVAFKFKRDLDPAKIEKFYVLGLFDQVLNQGSVDALIDISLVYDKLTF